jgi:hypothetical protein
MHVKTLAPAISTSWRTVWLRLTALAAALATGLDAFLLERKKGFFTGGFLAVDHVQSPGEAVLFLAASLLADAAVVGVLIAVGLWLTRGMRLTAFARTIALLAFGLAPLVIANFISYQLLDYLGDAFDIGLMFELTGRRPEEFLAVASSHVGVPLALIAGGSLCTVGMVWAVNRFAPGQASALRLHGGTQAWRWTIGLFVAGLCSTALLRAGTDVMENGLRRTPAGKFLGAIAEVATDVDRDGFGAIGRMNDPDPFDASIFPYAPDLPANGIDENGVAGDLPAGAVYAEPAGVAAGWTTKPDIVLVVLESFRADALGATLEGRAVTPVLDGLAANGISARHAFSHNGYTAQSRYHLFTGSLAGLRGGTSLIDDFQANGYEVAYFSGQDESFGGDEFAIGFDRADVRYDARVEPDRRYSTFSTAGSLAVPHDVVHEQVAAFLAARRSSRPLLLYVNFHDTHFPYHHDGIDPLVSRAALRRGQIGPARADDLRATYLNTAANVDRAVGAVLTTVRGALGRDPGIIVTSDHGESLYDEGFLGHGYALNDVQTRIPFIVTGLPLRLTEPMGQSDLRDALRAALSRSWNEGERPSLQQDAGKRVFQYLGTLRRPRQIGFVTVAGRTLYDFPSGRARVGAGDWRRPADLTPDERGAFEALAHTWERMAAARAATR